MINMKVKCTVCGLEETLDNESLEELSGIVKKYKMSADSYTYLLNKMRGMCMNDSEHSFIFDEEFMKQLQEIINAHVSDFAEIEKSRQEINSLIKEELLIEDKLREIKLKISNKQISIKSLYDSIQNNESNIESITGNINIDIWK